MPQDLWVGSYAGLQDPRNAEAAKNMYCAPARDCHPPPIIPRVHRPCSHDDVHEDGRDFTRRVRVMALRSDLEQGRIRAGCIASAS